MGSDEMTTQEQLDNAEDTINTLYARIDAIEATERELREAVRLLGTRIRVGSDLHDFMVTEYSQRDKDRKAMNRKRARMKTALFVACDEVEANPIAAAAVREAGR